MLAEFAVLGMQISDLREYLETACNPDTAGHNPICMQVSLLSICVVCVQILFSDVNICFSTGQQLVQWK